MVEDDKRLAAEAAAGEIRDAMVVGIGTGSTVRYLIEAIARDRLVRFREASFVATSVATSDAATRAGIPIRDMAEVGSIDLAIDGADEINPQLCAIKGGGGAMLREKVVAAAATRMIVVADGSKLADAIGAAPVPVEVLPFARAFVEAQLRALGADTRLRKGMVGPFRTDNGNEIIDCRFADLGDPADMARSIESIPGALGHGLFVTEVAAAYLAHDGVVTRLERQRVSR